jgi:mycothiol synthase
MDEAHHDVLIRDFRKSDLNELLDVTKESFAEEFEVSGFDPERVKEMVSRMFGIFGRLLLGFLKLLGKEPMKIFVAEIDKKVVGMTMVNNRRKVGYIANVMVHPEYRRRGIAKKLMENTLSYIQKKRNKAILHVISTNTPAKNMYTKLGFKKFENISYLTGDIDSLSKPKINEEINVRSFQKNDLDAVYNLIKTSEDPDHLKVFDFRKSDLQDSLLQRLMRFSKQEKLVTTKDGKILGYVQTHCTTPKEAGHIDNLNVYPERKSSGIGEALITAALEEIRQCGAKGIVATVSTSKQELIEIMTNLGFKKYLEMEGMFLEFEST